MDELLRSVLLELATDPQKMSEYLRGRESYLALAGLSPEACAALLEGDQEKVAHLVGAGDGHHTINMHEQEFHKKKKGKGKGTGKKSGKKTSKKTRK